MGSLIGKPKIPKLEPIKAPTAPTNNDAQVAAAAEADRLKKQRGRAATILGGAVGDDSSGRATKTLLGG